MINQAKILIVEDEALIALNMEKQLAKLGYKICAKAASGEEAISIVKDKSPDLILMDVRLVGKLNGIDTAQQIRMFSNIPIIFLTGYPDEELQEKIKLVGNVGCFIKPAKLSDLKIAIDSSFEKQ